MDKERIYIKLDEIDQYLKENRRNHTFFICRVFYRPNEEEGT